MSHQHFTGNASPVVFGFPWCDTLGALAQPGAACFSMTGQIRKNQHYVAQFLLGGFDIGSGGDTPKINVFDVQKDSLRFDQAVKEVFAQNYFYDKDNQIENFISEHIEGPASEQINKLRNGDFASLNNGDTRLIKFLCCQKSRTVEARRDALNFINAHFGEIVSDLSRLNNLNIDRPKEFRIVPKDKNSMRYFNASLALSGVIDSKGMEDLRFHLLRNETSKEFIISDHPVTRYNWLYRDLKDPRIGSLLAKGVQLFMPLSKDLYLCAYDSKTYKYGLKVCDISRVGDQNDVDWLNQLQVRSACSFIGFSGPAMQNYVRNLAGKFKGKKIYSRESEHLYQENMANGKIKTGHMVYTTQMKLLRKPSFVKVLKNAKPLAESFQERDPDVSQALMMLKSQFWEEDGCTRPEHQGRVSRGPGSMYNG